MRRKRKTNVIPFPSPGSPYKIEKYSRKFWSIKKDDELIAVTVYKKGAREVVKHLEERDALKRKFEGYRFISDLLTDKRSQSG